MCARADMYSTEVRDIYPYVFHRYVFHMYSTDICIPYVYVFHMYSICIPQICGYVFHMYSTDICIPYVFHRYVDMYSICIPYVFHRYVFHMCSTDICIPQICIPQKSVTNTNQSQHTPKPRSLNPQTKTTNTLNPNL